MLSLLPWQIKTADFYTHPTTGVFDISIESIFCRYLWSDYGLISKELELLKRWNAVTDVMLKSANLPTKQEIEEIYEEIHNLKNRIFKLELDKKKAEKNARK